MPASPGVNRNVNTLSITASATVGIDVDQVLADATSGAITVTLYTDPGDGAAHQIIVQKTDNSANAITVTDGTFTFSLASLSDSVICQMTQAGDWIGVSGFDVTGTGDVDGPGSAVTANLASFNGTTGKIIQDSGVATTQVSTNASAAASATLSGVSASQSIAGSAALSGTSASQSIAASATLSGTSASQSIAGSAVLSGVSGTASVATSQNLSQSANTSSAMSLASS